VRSAPLEVFPGDPSHIALDQPDHRDLMVAMNRSIAFT
jgi:hypothetical protein